MNAPTEQPQPQKKRGAKRPQQRKPAREVHPVLHQLYDLHPLLFGSRFLPLKLGIYEDLLAAHPGVLDPAELKVAMGLHARSNRYLEAVASGLPRHDLDAKPVEPVAPEHVHHAILELYRRRSGSPEREAAAREAAVRQMAEAVDRSGLGRDEYRERFGQNEASHAIVEEALAVVAQRTARREALLRAWTASGQTAEAFAEMYGLAPEEVAALTAQAGQ
jgi:sRNA-binding protein